MQENNKRGKLFGSGRDLNLPKIFNKIRLFHEEFVVQFLSEF